MGRPTYEERATNPNNGGTKSCKIKLFDKPNGEKMKVFLGGTCNRSVWRNILISKLEIDYFNPVVDDWTEDCYQEELRQRELCDVCLYVITSNMTRSYSIAEVVDDSNKRPNKTIFMFLKEGFDKGQIKSLNKVGDMVLLNGGTWINGGLNEVARYLNEIGNKPAGFDNYIIIK